MMEINDTTGKPKLDVKRQQRKPLTIFWLHQMPQALLEKQKGGVNRKKIDSEGIQAANLVSNFACIPYA